MSASEGHYPRVIIRGKPVITTTGSLGELIAAGILVPLYDDDKARWHEAKLPTPAAAGEVTADGS
jgi:hypothetical protein